MGDDVITGQVNGQQPTRSSVPLELERLFEQKKLVVIGGTGFLGKVFWSLLLSRYAGVGRIYLVVRSKAELDSSARFWQEIAPSEALSALRAQYGEHYLELLRDKIVPIEGDIVSPFCGLDAALREELRGEIAAVVNVAGIVDFQPPLDMALTVNAFGVQNLVALARDLGNCPLLHTSTCFVAGSRTGFIEEEDPRLHPFPRVLELERAHWDPDREISECLAIIEQAKQRACDAFRQSHFLNEARATLLKNHEPATGEVLEQEIARVKRRYIEAQLAEMGNERAQFWGWPNTYTYTKSIGEQIVAGSGLPYTIVRPAIVESSVSFPAVGWNEGINTSAPLIYVLREGQQQMPGSTHTLDVIPCDMVASGIVLALGELLEGTAAPVYQLGSSDSNPVSHARIFELTGLYKRKYYQRTQAKGPLVSFLQSHLEGGLLSSANFEKYGPRAIAKGARSLGKLLDKASSPELGALLSPAKRELEQFAKAQERVAKLFSMFAPFTADYDYTFRSDNVRSARDRLKPEDARRLNWAPETIDWRQWFFEVHMPGLERWVFPEIEERIRRPVKPLKQHETLTNLLEEMARRHDLRVALQRTEADGLSRIAFTELRERALACAQRLANAGVGHGDRVVIMAANHPAWPMAFFGVLYAGATVVPVDPKIEAHSLAEILAHAGAKACIVDAEAAGRLASTLATVVCLDLLCAVDAGERPEWTSQSESQSRTTPPQKLNGADDVAVLAYSRSSTASLQGVMLSHGNLCSLIAALAPLFPLGPGDRVLSVLPLHQTFELSCGLLLPLSRGARVVYLDEVNAERLEYGLKASAATAMVGAPALWEAIERTLHSRVQGQGPFASRAFELGLELNRVLQTKLGLDAGRVLFGSLHEALGGNLKYLISGGAGLSGETLAEFAKLGLHLSEGYSMSDAGPVLALGTPNASAQPGLIGRPIPGVELRVLNPNPEGVGEILARGPSVMLGYYADKEATRQVIDDEGWLHTGDLGRLDRRGRLKLMGRAADRITGPSGEDIHSSDSKQGLGIVPGAGNTDNQDAFSANVRATIASVCRKAPREISSAQSLRQDLGFDSLMLLELLLLLESQIGKPLDLEQLSTKQRVLELEQALREAATPAATDAMDALATKQTTEPWSIEQDTFRIPVPLRQAAMAWLATAQSSFYARVMRTKVSGRAFIPHNRNVIVVANHASHLDLGLVKYALGSYAENLVALPARDHFYEGGRFRRLYVEQLTSWVALDRGGSLQQTLNQVHDQLREGRTLLIFPEGMRSRDGSLLEFESLAAHLALEHKLDILPLWLGGTGDALPKGATLLKARKLEARIGPLFEYRDMQRVTAELEPKQRPRSITRLLQNAVRELSQGGALDLSTTKAVIADATARNGATPHDAARAAATPAGLAGVFSELPLRFRAGSVKSPICYYFSLGEERWTVQVNAESCNVTRGKTVEVADCVLKTSPDLFTRIVREAYSPSPTEFLSGRVKSNNIAALMTFQKIFQLTP